MNRILLAVFLACVAVGVVIADGTNSVVVVDASAAQQRIADAKSKYRNMTDAQRAAREAEIERRRQNFINAYTNNPNRIISRVVNTNGTVTIIRANGKTQTYRYVEKN